MTEGERTSLEEIGETGTSSASQAKDILRFVFDDVFIESNYSDTTYFRLDYETELTQLSIHPNPASGNIRIQYFLNDENNSCALKLYDVTGRSIQQWKLVSGSTELFIDTRNYSNGVYMIELSLGNEFAERQKFIIQNEK